MRICGAGWEGGNKKNHKKDLRGPAQRGNGRPDRRGTHTRKPDNSIKEGVRIISEETVTQKE